MRTPIVLMATVMCLAALVTEGEEQKTPPPTPLAKDAPATPPQPVPSVRLEGKDSFGDPNDLAEGKLYLEWQYFRARYDAWYPPTVVARIRKKAAATGKAASFPFDVDKKLAEGEAAKKRVLELEELRKPDPPLPLPSDDYSFQAFNLRIQAARFRWGARQRENLATRSETAVTRLKAGEVVQAGTALTVEEQIAKETASAKYNREAAGHLAVEVWGLELSTALIEAGFCTEEGEAIAPLNDLGLKNLATAAQRDHTKQVLYEKLKKQREDYDAFVAKYKKEHPCPPRPASSKP